MEQFKGAFAGISFRADEEAKVDVSYDKDAKDPRIVSDVLDWPFAVAFKLNGNRIGIYLTKSLAEDLFAQLGQCLQESDCIDAERAIKKVFEEGGKS